MTPFDHFWAAYPKERRTEKGLCQVNFDRFSLEEQRFIYQDMKNRAQYSQDWLDSYVPKTLNYLNSLCWQGGIFTKPIKPDNTKDTTEDNRPEIVQLQSELVGLQRFRKQLEDSKLGQGANYDSIVRQIEALEQSIAGQA